jgi:hypothetical protein
VSSLLAVVVAVGAKTVQYPSQDEACIFTEAPMVPFFYALDVTAYFRVRQVEGLFEGAVDLLQGAEPVRTEHRCSNPRRTEAEALRDARKDASALIKIWRERRPRQ